MKKLARLINIVIILSFLIQFHALSKNYAIVISGGYGYPDGITNEDQSKDSYWRDLVWAYEYLILDAGYTHDDIFVFFGDGTDWTNTTVNDNRYDLTKEHPSWPDIVDYDNSKSSLENQLNNFKNNILTNNDNILIWVPRSHGLSNLNEYDESYSMPMIPGFGQFSWELNEQPSANDYLLIYDLLNLRDSNGSPKYRRRKILWATCRCGHLLVGNKTLLNDGNTNYEDDEKTIALVSCSYTELGQRPSYYGPSAEEHSGFNFAVIGTLTGLDPWGRKDGNDNPYTIEDYPPLPNRDPFFPDLNNDGVISMYELNLAIGFKGVGEEYRGDMWWSSSWDDRTGDNSHTTPQFADPGNIAKYTYIDEYLKLNNATLTLNGDDDNGKRYYWVDKILAEDNLIIPNGSNIIFAVDTEVRLKPGFHAVNGSRFHAYIGGVE